VPSAFTICEQVAALIAGECPSLKDSPLRGCLAESVATGESIDGGEGRATHCGGGSKIFFDR
jgi:hypothetical protein